MFCGILFGGLLGAFGALVSAQVIGKKYKWSVKFEHAPYGPVLLALLLVGVVGGAAVNGAVAANGFLASLLSLALTAPAIIAGVVLVIAAVPLVKHWANALSDAILGLITTGPSKEQTLQKRVDELEATVRELQAK